MRCEELLIQDAGQRNQVKRIHQSVVNVLIVFIQAFVSEVEERSHLSAFVIASYKGDCAESTAKLGKIRAVNAIKAIGTTEKRRSTKAK